MPLRLSLELSRDSFVWGEPVHVTAILGIDGTDAYEVTDLDPSHMVWELSILGEVEPSMFRPPQVLPRTERFQLEEGDELGSRLDVHRWLPGPGRFELRCTYTQCEPHVRSDKVTWTVEPCLGVRGAPVVTSGARELVAAPAFTLLRGASGASLLNLLVGELEDDAPEPLAILSSETVARLPPDADELCTVWAPTGDIDPRTAFVTWTEGSRVCCGVDFNGFVRLEHTLAGAARIVTPVLCPAPATADVLAVVGDQLHRVRFGPLELLDEAPGPEPDDDTPVDPTDRVRKPAPTVIASTNLPASPIHATWASLGDHVAVALTARTDEEHALVVGVGPAGALPTSWTVVSLTAELTPGTIAAFVDAAGRLVVVTPGLAREDDQLQLVALAHAFDVGGRSVVAPGTGYRVVASLDGNVRETAASVYAPAGDAPWRADVVALMANGRWVGQVAGRDVDVNPGASAALPARLLSTELAACFAAVRTDRGSPTFVRL